MVNADAHANAYPYAIEDIQLMVSLFCPGKCVNCNIWQAPKAEVTKNELPLDLLETAFKSSLLKSVRYFDLTAGESQVSPRYVPIVRLINTYFPQAAIHTNISGWYPEKHLEVTKACLDIIKPENFHIDISLDGREENYSKVRLLSNGYSKALKTAKLLRDLNIRLRFIMTVYPENHQDIEWLIDLAKDYGIGYYFGYPRVSPNNFKNEGKTYYNDPETLHSIESRLEKTGYLTPRRKPQWLWAKSVYENRIPLFDCHMGKKAIVIDPYGNVFPCNELLPQLNMGNLKDFNGNLDALLKSQRALAVVEGVGSKKCQPCGMLCAQKIIFPWGPQSGLIPEPDNTHPGKTAIPN